ncbi:MAG: hypothetical protein CMO55_18045 [Verrucomicrobiales bacterium]|nr:hypothetical protein [Verrucomicrobiales bacterium]
MEPSFEKFLVLLINAEVNFIVVGGLAVTLNGYVRLTEDVDILVDLDPDNLHRLISTLSQFGDGYGGEMTLDDFTPDPGAIRLIEESENLQVDIFSCMDGLSYSQIIHGTEEGQLGAKKFAYASKAQLIRFKSSSVREKDRIDVSAMKQLIENPRAFD